MIYRFAIVEPTDLSGSEWDDFSSNDGEALINDVADKMIVGWLALDDANPFIPQRIIDLGVPIHTTAEIRSLKGPNGFKIAIEI